MNNTLEERSMAFMNCPWKNTAGCNYICAACFRSDPEGLKGLLDSIERLPEQRETSEAKDERI